MALLLRSGWAWGAIFGTLALVGLTALLLQAEWLYFILKNCRWRISRLSRCTNLAGRPRAVLKQAGRSAAPSSTNLHEIFRPEPVGLQAIQTAMA
jgi:hypothetical protein